MKEAHAAVATRLLRNLPSVDEVMRSPAALRIAESAGDRNATVLVRRVIDEYRSAVIAGSLPAESKNEVFSEIESRLEEAWCSEQLGGTHRVINATGVVIHTNLGRAPLSEDARRAVADVTGYCTVEYDLETGKRRRRGSRVERSIIELTGAEDALIVNNCAAAAFFVLTAFAAGGEVVISRGELVEIGGDFRVPDVLTQSQAELREVGTTNRTKLADYEKAINDRTRLILRVHPSNYRIVGFTAMPTASELADLAHRHNLIVYEDLGSGALIELTDIGLGDEPVASRSIDAGVDVVTFSGDKLLGGPQAGIIAGRGELIGGLRKHPLYRALRVDKLAYAALEATLGAYSRGTAADDVPVLRMLSQNREQIAQRVSLFVERFRECPGALSVEIVDGQSATGGGAAPAVPLETKLIALTHPNMNAMEVEKLLRNSRPPVISRIVDDRVVLDLRTVSEECESELIEAVKSLSSSQ